MNKDKLIELRCKAWGITENEYYCNQCSDFSLEDMARAYRRGKNKGVEFANETTKELEKENAELKEKLAGAERTRERLVQLGFPTFQSCKEYAELIEKMKCCGNCAKNGHICVAEEMQGKLCGKNKDKWELKR